MFSFALTPAARRNKAVRAENAAYLARIANGERRQLGEVELTGEAE